MNPSWRRAFAVFLFSVWQGCLPFCFWNPAPEEHSPHLVTKLASPSIGSWPWRSFLAFCHLFQWISYGAESQNLLGAVRAPTTWEIEGAGGGSGGGLGTCISNMFQLCFGIARGDRCSRALVLYPDASGICPLSPGPLLPPGPCHSFLPYIYLPSPIRLQPVFLWLIHIRVQQKRHCKATILQLKTNF